MTRGRRAQSFRKRSFELGSLLQMYLPRRSDHIDARRGARVHSVAIAAICPAIFIAIPSGRRA